MRKPVVFAILVILLVSMGITNLVPVRAKAGGNEIAMEELAPSVQGSGTAGTGTLTVASFYSVHISANGKLTLNGGVGFFNGSLSNVPDVAGAYQVQAFSSSSSGCVLSGTVVLGPFVGQPVTETVFGNCFPSQTLEVLVAFEFGDINRPVFAGHGVGTLSPITGTLDALLVGAQVSGSGTCGTITMSLFSISVINIPSSSSQPAVGLANAVQTQLSSCLPVSLFVSDSGTPTPIDITGCRFQTRQGLPQGQSLSVSYGISNCLPTGIQPVTVTLQLIATPAVQLFSGQGTGFAALIVL